MSERSEFDEARQHGLEARHETRVERAIRRAVINAEWKAQADDTVDGWCVLDAASEGTPATGNVPIAHFCHAEAARHMAAIHNVWLANQGHRPIPGSVVDTIRVQVSNFIADLIDDYPGPDPSPASPAWWAGYEEAKRDCALIARSFGSKEGTA